MAERMSIHIKEAPTERGQTEIAPDAEVRPGSGWITYEKLSSEIFVLLNPCELR
jgi:hypothetical protein